MAHSVEEMAYTVEGGTPWHGLGIPVLQAMDPEDALKIAKLNWDLVPCRMEAVYDIPVLDGSGKKVGVNTHRVGVPFPEYRGLVRVKKNGHDEVIDAISVVGGRYRIFQNREMVEFLRLLAVEGGIKIHTAGSLDGGRRVWMMGRLDRTMVVAPDDIVDSNVFITNSHDGSSRITVGATAVRIVCMNTLRLALQDVTETGKGVGVRHVGEPMDKVAEVQRVLGIVAETFTAQEEFFKKLQALPLNIAQATDALHILMPSAADPKRDRAGSIRTDIMDILQNDPTCTMKGVQGTVWGFVNAVSRFVDWKRHPADPKHPELDMEKAEKRLSSAWFGEGDSMKDRAIEIGVGVSEGRLPETVQA